MKRRNESVKRGVVLLLILGLMAMFAISVLSYMIVTSNMAETAQNAQKIDEEHEIPTLNDVNYALKNVLIGSDNESNPIAPFSILENMYGDWKDYYVEWDDNGNVTWTSENPSTEFRARIAIFPNLGFALLVPTSDFDNRDILDNADSLELRKIFSFLFENSGGVLTFKDANFDEDVPVQRDALAFWNADVRNTSTFVLEKVITNPSHPGYLGRTSSGTSYSPSGDYWAEHYVDGYNSEDAGNKSFYTDFDFWHFKVELTDDLKRFITDFGTTALLDFNHSAPEVVVRLNRPAYSGTGAGGFSPGDKHDALFVGMGNVPGIPYLFWANAAAPDFYNFLRMKNDAKPSFRSYWAHLTDVSYFADSQSGYYSFDKPDGKPVVGGSGNYPDSVRLNSPYTATDSRSLFLARAEFDNTDPSFPLDKRLTIIPSFHRPSLFNELLVDQDDKESGGTYRYIDLFSNAFSSNPARMSGLIRRLTPRPLPFDHYNFTGGNPRFDFHNGATIENLEYLVSGLAGRDETGKSGAEWDVDNDGDGVRDGIWIPSGLPIRYDKNGTPYATMLSYMILDMDGRVNVNTAGTWDQLPNKMRPPTAPVSGYSQPYDYVEDLADIWNNAISGGVGVGTPFHTADNLNADFGWLDDSGRKNDGERISRGEGRGGAELRLFDTLQEIFGNFDNNGDLLNYDEIETIATNLLWRRYRTYADKQTSRVDTSALSWGVNGISLNGVDVPQPGLVRNGAEVDDSMGSRYEVFRFNDPMRLYSKELSNGNSASISESRFVFPWRGKTTLSMSTLADMAPAFDYAGTALRSYDPLGNQIYSYAPRYSNNPYMAYQNVRTLYDTSYGLTMLERLLRPFDADVTAMESQLYDDLLMNRPSNGDPKVVNDRRKARFALTTISSDVPSPSLVFPENFQGEDEPRYGNYGFVDLIRRNVRAELKRIFEVKGNAYLTGVSTPDGEPVPVWDRDFAPNNALVFERKVEEITQYLASLLPKEILVGEKIDLNALAQKNYWLDVDYDRNIEKYVPASEFEGSDTHDVGLLKRMEYARGLYLVVMTLLYEDMNGKTLYGLKDDGGDSEEEDDSDEDDDSGEDDDVVSKLADYIEGSFDLLKVDDKDRNKSEYKRDLMARELTATRIAQWCVNVVDFSDPDATMTPFFFDPTPFDGWWLDGSSWIDGDLATETITNSATNQPQDVNKWENRRWLRDDDPPLNYLFSPTQGMPTETMFEFFYDALVNSVGSERDEERRPSVYRDAANNSLMGYPDRDEWIRDPNWQPEEGLASTPVARQLRSNEIVALWLKRKIEKLEDQTSDLGFRLVWGMERPDLLLTETLSFHDLGIADTDKAFEKSVVPSGAQDTLASEDSSEDFDQVRRPMGSTYLELYCAANPNVPQSQELYTYDLNTQQWALRLSKPTPVYVDSMGRQLKVPVWRIAISDSTDVCGLHEYKNPEEISDANVKNSQLRKGNDVVYHKAGNSILAHLTPQKKFIPGEGAQDGESKYLDDISFFSMQPRQFRNLPFTRNDCDVAQLSDLDLDQGLDDDGKIKESTFPDSLKDWKQFNLYASNVLGPAVAEAMLGVEAARENEIELDRIVWFVGPDGHKIDNTKKIPALAEYPDALRTFYPILPDNLSPAMRASGNNVILGANQYLVMAPEKARAIGSAAFHSTSTDESARKFGQKPMSEGSIIDLDTIGANLPGVASNAPLYCIATSNIGGKGLNISEPLWTAKDKDPYHYLFDPNDGVSDIRDVPFEMPAEWGDRGNFDQVDGVDIADYPIVKDKLFGLGTAPGYKSAFVQRVADPNRPYHPLMNPYITVDWNMMDLTVFTGENYKSTLAEDIDRDNETTFAKGDDYPFKEKNKIKLARNVALGFDDEDADKKYDLTLDEVFSSRQWGSFSQKTFAPTLGESNRPNPWARAFKSEGNKAGLEGPTDVIYTASGVNTPAFPRAPKHTLGYYNGVGERGYWDVDNEGKCKFYPDDTSDPYTYRGINPDFVGRSGVYKGAPGVPLPITPEPQTINDYAWAPLEHLVWNDAPYGNPYELLMVPASAPGRFGLEFVRKDSRSYDLSKSYDTKKANSLGSFDNFGFSDWYTDSNTKDVKEGLDRYIKRYYKRKTGRKMKKEDIGAIGPYLNFLASSTTPGETLNLCKILDFVHTPSSFLGSKKLAGRDLNGDLISDEYGNPIIRSKRREPGKININTASNESWKALGNGRSATWLGDINWDFTSENSVKNGRRKDMLSDDPFQPATAMSLWCEMGQSEPPEPTHASLLARYDGDDHPIFDNGNVIGYHYLDPKDLSASDSGTWKDTYNIDWFKKQVNDGVFEEYSSITDKSYNIHTATEEMQRLSGLTTTRSNVFAVWVTVGYFEVERCNPGVNMPDVDPDGNPLTIARLVDPTDKWYQYYQAIYPDGYTYGRELGIDSGEIQRHRGFSIIDRSIPVDFRRGNSVNYEKTILTRRVLD